MRSLFISILFTFTIPSFACPKLAGTWNQCSISTEFLNPVELLAVNVALKSYTFKFSNPRPNIINAKITKSNFFSSPDIILDEVSVIGKNNTSIWDKNIVEGSTAPIFTIFYECTNSGMNEYSIWENLTIQNYPDHAHKDFPKYYKSVYSVSGNKITRNLYSRKSPEEKYGLIARITCKK